ncbi:MAG: hypothetical protein IT370_00090 [Deltaproteobacteria bacterium]|nr:hypothetical protein [Deltaproteobacteria bacterium]
MRVGAKFVGMVMVVGLGAGVVGLGCAKKKRDAAPATSPVVSAAPSAAPATVSPGPVASPAPVEVEVAKVAGSPSPDQLCAGDCAVPANRMARPAYEASCEATLARVKACSKHAAFKALESRDAIVTLTKDVDYACSEMASDLYHAPIPDDVDAYQELTYSDDLTGEEVGALAAVPEGDCAALAKVAGAIDWPTEHGE